MNAFIAVIVLLALAAIVVVLAIPFVIVAAVVEWRRRRRMAETQDPEEFVRLLLREAVDCSVAVISEQLLIKYNLDKISANAGSLAGSRFLEFAKTVRALVPVLFAKFKQFDALEIEAFRGMTDIRGHTSLQPYYRVGLTRTNSESINWPHIHLENVPAIADSFWEHPTKQSQFDRPVEEDNDP